MSVRTLLLVTLALLVGAAGTWMGRRAHERAAAARLPAPIRRSSELREALRAHEAGDTERLDRALVALSGQSDVPEALLLSALAADDRAVLQRLADDPAGGAVAARAALALWRGTQDPRERAARHAAFAARHPRSWVLRSAWARGP